MFQIHIENPDYVGIKTGLRQLALRLEAEITAAKQWSALAKNRGAGEVPAMLDKAISSLDSAADDIAKAADMVVEIQKEAHHEH